MRCGVNPPQSPFNIIHTYTREMFGDDVKVVERVVEKPVEKIVFQDDPATLTKLYEAMQENAELKRFQRRPVVEVVEKIVEIEKTVDKIVPIIDKRYWWLIGSVAFALGLILMKLFK